MAGAYRVQVGGIHALADQLRNRKFMLYPSRRLIEGAGVAARKTAQRAAKPHAADKGTLGRVILMTLRDRGETAVVDVPRRITGLAFTIEEGRRPGRRPPYKPIKRWMISHGIIPEGRGTSKRIQFMRETIRQRGTKGIHFMAAGADAANKVIRTGVPRTANEIKALWDRGI